MRVSPALLACFSLVAISASPTRAASASETVDGAPTLEANQDIMSPLAANSVDSAVEPASRAGAEAAIAPTSVSSNSNA
ncbi:MAG: hypothetical protein AAGL17_13570, partial [Cyanobacteria bacterium J06576_12]